MDCRRPLEEKFGDPDLPRDLAGGKEMIVIDILATVAVLLLGMAATALMAWPSPRDTAFAIACVTIILLGVWL